ncbi:MAG: hypothetical protein K0U41_04855 [Gammaproteobacteria bacterium]|nr:hypothetical protein [Gammaproteobacteria bacterium]
MSNQLVSNRRPIGVGTEGYLRVQVEDFQGLVPDNFRTGATLIGTIIGTSINPNTKKIPRKKALGSLYMQPDLQGSRYVTGEIKFIANTADLQDQLQAFGFARNRVLNTAPTNTEDTFFSNSGVAPTSRTDLRTASRTFTMEDAWGSNTPYYYTGCIVTKFRIEATQNDNVIVTLSFIGNDPQPQVLRTNIPELGTAYNIANDITFGEGSTVLNFNSNSNLTVQNPLANEESTTLRPYSFFTEIDFMYEEESYDIGSKTRRAYFRKDIPMVSVGFNLDAELYFVQKAINLDVFNGTIVLFNGILEDGSRLRIESRYNGVQAEDNSLNRVLEHNIMDFNFKGNFHQNPYELFFRTTPNT